MKMLLNGEWVNASDNRTRKVVNPANGEVIDVVPESTQSDARRAIATAQIGKRAMRQMPAADRSAALFCIAAEMQNRKEELSVLLAKENGKPIRQTREELGAAIRIFQGFAEEAKRLLGKVVPMDAIPGQKNNFAFTIRQPVGVVVAIIPFNYPVELFAHKVAAALAAGNAVISKPPEDCPLTLLRVAEIMEKSGLPKYAHQMITGAGEVIGEVLVSDPGTQLITLTGSVLAGKRVSELAASNLKKVHLELGGNDAVIVCADADLELAAEGIVLGRLARGNGQICCAVKRVFVDETVHDRFVEILTKKTKALKVGDQSGEDIDVGPLITEAAAKLVESDIKVAVSAGAVIKTGGNRSGNFIEPTVLVKVPTESKIFHDETFGPVVPVVAFKTMNDAVRMANDSPYGLQAAIFTRDINLALDTAHRLEVGGVIINWGSAVRMESLPFGGLKFSGHGRESLADTILEMTEQKTIYIHDALTAYWQD
jgi:acyl-CoA reductase-like NAD-dependent aldehyde dehydrogenase